MDTIIVIVMLLCPVPHTVEKENRFKSQFEQADSAFNHKYKIDMDALREASKRAAKEADEKTREEREKVLNSWNLFKIR